MNGTCQNCKREGAVERHHILPRRYYYGFGGTIKLCPNCHTDIESDIYYLETFESKQRVQLKKEDYQRLARQYSR